MSEPIDGDWGEEADKFQLVEAEVVELAEEIARVLFKAQNDHQYTAKPSTDKANATIMCAQVVAAAIVTNTMAGQVDEEYTPRAPGIVEWVERIINSAGTMQVKRVSRSEYKANGDSTVIVPKAKA